MKDDIQRRLRTLLEMFPDLLDNERRLKVVLKDCFPREKLTQNLLYMTAESGLLRSAQTAGRVDKFGMHGYVKCLTEDYGIGARAAKDTIVQWLTALDLPYEDIVVEESAPKKKAPVIRVPEPKKEEPDPLAEEREEGRRLEEIIRDYNGLLVAVPAELEEQSSACCFRHQAERFHITDEKFWVSEIKKQPGTPDWWTICWRRSRYWAFPFAETKYAVFPNPKLIFEGYLHTVPRLYDLFTMITLEEDYDCCVRAEPAVLTVRDGIWKKFSGGILYIG